MASDLISRKELMSMHYDMKYTEVKGEVFVRLEDVVNWIKLIPTVDAVEVVHAKWERVYLPRNREAMRCSNCRKHLGTFDLTDYCPHCGAKMDGGDKE